MSAMVHCITLTGVSMMVHIYWETGRGQLYQKFPETGSMFVCCNV